MARFVVCYGLLYLATPPVGSSSFDDVANLMRKLGNITGHDGIRPLQNQSSTITVSVEFSVTYLESLDMLSGEVVVSGVLSLTWVDEFLQWDPANHGGISRINLSKDASFWKPSVILAHQDSEDTGIAKAAFCPISVTHKGLVRWVSAKTFRSKCAINMMSYPFDSHACEFKFLVPDYSSSEVELLPATGTIGLANFAENGEWRVKATTAKGTTLSPEYTDVSMAAAVYTMLLERRPQFIMIHVLAPTEIITGLNTMAYFVPVQSGERISYSITLYLAFVFTTSTSLTEIPRNSVRIIYHSQQIIAINIFMAFGVVWSITQVRLSGRRTEDEIPTWLQNFTRSIIRLRKIMCGFKPVKPAPKLQQTVTFLQNEDEPEENHNHGMKTHRQVEQERDITWLDVVEVLDLIYFDISICFLVSLLIILGVLSSVENGSFILS